MNSTRKQLQILIEQNRLAPKDTEAAARVSGVLPTSSAWLQFLDRALLMLGCLAISCSLMFFVAYNWLEFGRFAKFALLESVIVLATIAYVFFQRSKTSNLVSQAALLVACLSLGVLLALFGQTYQTGADPWQLFFNWALLMVPWLLLSRSSWLWLFWCVLLNTSLVLWMHAYGVSIFHYGKSMSTMWATLVLNASILVAWELASNRFSWIANRWATHTLSAFAIYAVTLAALTVRFTDSGLTMLIALLSIFGAGYVYIKLKPDLFTLTMLALSVSVIALTLFGEFVFNTSSDAIGASLIMIFATLAIGTTCTVWLKNVHKRLLNQEAAS